MVGLLSTPILINAMFQGDRRKQFVQFQRNCLPGTVDYTFILKDSEKSAGGNNES